MSRKVLISVFFSQSPIVCFSRCFQVIYFAFFRFCWTVLNLLNIFDSHNASSNKCNHSYYTHFRRNFYSNFHYFWDLTKCFQVPEISWMFCDSLKTLSDLRQKRFLACKLCIIDIIFLSKSNAWYIIGDNIKYIMALYNSRSFLATPTSKIHITIRFLKICNFFSNIICAKCPVSCKPPHFAQEESPPGGGLSSCIINISQ